MRTRKKTYKEASYKVKLTKRYKDRGYNVRSISQRYHAGWPDLQVVIEGVTFYIELKVQGNTATELQKKTLFDLAASGAPALTMTRMLDKSEVIELYLPDGETAGYKGSPDEIDFNFLFDLSSRFPVAGQRLYRKFVDPETDNHTRILL